MTKRIIQVSDLINQGMSDQEIAAELGTTIPSVKSAKHRARKDGLIPPHKPKGGYAGFKRKLHGSQYSIGHMKDALAPLTDTERNWLFIQAQDDGYTSIAECLCDMIRSEYDQTLARKAKAA